MTETWLREPGRGRYARPERERRFLLARVPADATAPRDIEDRYIDGTTMRLRRMSRGTQTVWKLTQKVRVDDGGPVSVACTNLYLSADEHGILAALPAHAVSKTRWQWAAGDVNWAVDQLTDRWHGLVLAECDADVAGVDVVGPLCREVTEDERFTGAALANATDADVRATLGYVRDVVAECC